MQYLNKLDNWVRELYFCIFSYKRHPKILHLEAFSTFFLKNDKFWQNWVISNHFLKFHFFNKGWSLQGTLRATKHAFLVLLWYKTLLSFSVVQSLSEDPSDESLSAYPPNKLKPPDLADFILCPPVVCLLCCFTNPSLILLIIPTLSNGPTDASSCSSSLASLSVPEVLVFSHCLFDLLSPDASYNCLVSVDVVLLAVSSDSLCECSCTLDLLLLGVFSDDLVGFLTFTSPANDDFDFDSPPTLTSQDFCFLAGTGDAPGESWGKIQRQ